MAANPRWREWRHRVCWPRLHPGIPTVPHLWNLDQRVQRYEQKCIYAKYSAPYSSKVTKIYGALYDGVLSLFYKFDVKRSKGCWDMASRPVWRRRRHIWFVVMGEQSRNCKIRLVSFVRIRPKILCANFRDNRSKFVTAENFLRFSTKSKMAENLVRRKLTSKGALDSSWSNDTNYLVFEIQTNESKVIKLNVLQTLTCWWR